MINNRTSWTATHILTAYLCVCLFETLLIIGSFFVSATTIIPFQLAYFLGWCLAVTSVPILPYALLIAVRHCRAKYYATMTLAIFAAGIATLGILGGTIILIFKTAMVGTPEF